MHATECSVGFHTSAILSISVATRRTLLATASRDNTVRVWDYHRLVCRVSHQASDPVKVVALHPWGTELVLAVYDGAHTYVIAGDALVRGQRLTESTAGAWTSVQVGHEDFARRQAHSPPRTLRHEKCGTIIKAVGTVWGHC
jgi:hypothetical protein